MQNLPIITYIGNYATVSQEQSIIYKQFTKGYTNCTIALHFQQQVYNHILLSVVDFIFFGDISSDFDITPIKP